GRDEARAKVDHGHAEGLDAARTNAVVFGSHDQCVFVQTRHSRSGQSIGVGPLPFDVQTSSSGFAPGFVSLASAIACGVGPLPVTERSVVGAAKRSRTASLSPSPPE